MKDQQTTQAATYLARADLDALQKTVEDSEQSLHMLECMLRSKAEVLTRATDNENDNGLYRIEGLSYLMDLLATHAEDIRIDIGKVNLCLNSVCARAEEDECEREQEEDAQDAARAQAGVEQAAYERARAAVDF